MRSRAERQHIDVADQRDDDAEEDGKRNGHCGGIGR